MGESSMFVEGVIGSHSKFEVRAQMLITTNSNMSPQIPLSVPVESFANTSMLAVTYALIVPISY